MALKRVRQFYINVTDKMSKGDYDYIEEILDDGEVKLFKKLSKSEQKHSVRIAKEIENLLDGNFVDDSEIVASRDILVKAALLHDVGKVNQKLNVFDKSIIVILNKLTDGKLRNFEKSKKVQCYYNHAQYSYDILKGMVSSDLLLEIIKYHHSHRDNQVVEFFKEIDDKN